MLKVYCGDCCYINILVSVYATSLWLFYGLLGSAGESPVPPHPEPTPASVKQVTPSLSPRPPSEPELPPSPPPKVEEPPPLPEERQPEGQQTSAALPISVAMLVTVLKVHCYE